MCSWSRFVRVPQTTDREFDELISRHVGRSLQWEWQVHMKDEHAPLAAAYECLTPGAFDDWVSQEGAPSVPQETPPSEGEGYSVRANPPGTITPEQARNLADAVERTMISAAEGIQRFAEHMVPALHSAQETLIKGLRDLVEQQRGQPAPCACGGVSGHCPGDKGCLFRPIPVGQANLTRTFWRNLYGPVPAVHVQRDLDDGVPGDRPYGTVDAEICSNCQRLSGEPHGLPSCLELS